MIDVTLREQRDADADVVFEWMRDPVAVRMAAFTHKDPDDREAFDAWLARILGNPDIIHRVIEVDGEIVGTIATFTAGFVEVGRDVGFAEGVGTEVEETIFRLS